MVWLWLVVAVLVGAVTALGLCSHVALRLLEEADDFASNRLEVLESEARATSSRLVELVGLADRLDATCRGHANTIGHLRRDVNELSERLEAMRRSLPPPPEPIELEAALQSQLIDVRIPPADDSFY